MRWWIAVAGSAAAIAAQWRPFADGEVAIAVVDALAGAAFVAVGAVTVGRPGSRRFATVAALGGLAWFAGSLVDSFVYLHRPLMAHAALSYPAGRLPGRVACGVVAFAWLGAAAVPVGLNAGATIALGVGLLTVAATQLDPDGRGLQRRAVTVSRRATAVLAVALLVPTAIRILVPVSPIADGVTVGHAAAVTLAGVVLLTAGLLRTGGAADAADAVVELADMPSPEVDVMAAVGQEDAGLAGRIDDPAMRVALETAADLLKANTQLEADLRAQVDDVRQSRRRLVAVADVESQRLERRLVEGTGKQIDDLENTLAELAQLVDGDAELMVGRVSSEIAALRDDLARLGRGLHPRRLVDDGLRAALVDLAQRSVVPIDVVVAADRLPSGVEKTLWYVCAEAVANAGKHADARMMQITIEHRVDVVVATVVDDGVGGARLSSGRGLTGLADRLDAVGGRLELSDRPDGGTRLQALVPLA